MLNEEYCNRPTTTRPICLFLGRITCCRIIQNNTTLHQSPFWMNDCDDIKICVLKFMDVSCRPMLLFYTLRCWFTPMRQSLVPSCASGTWSELGEMMRYNDKTKYKIQRCNLSWTMINMGFSLEMDSNKGNVWGKSDLITVIVQWI